MTDSIKNFRDDLTEFITKKMKEHYAHLDEEMKHLLEDNGFDWGKLKNEDSEEMKRAKEWLLSEGYFIGGTPLAVRNMKDVKL